MYNKHHLKLSKILVHINVYSLLKFFNKENQSNYLSVLPKIYFCLLVLNEKSHLPQTTLKMLFPIHKMLSNHLKPVLHRLRHYLCLQCLHKEVVKENSIIFLILPNYIMDALILLCLSSYNSSQLKNVLQLSFCKLQHLKHLILFPLYFYRDQDV